MSRRRAKSISLEDCASATGPGPMAQFFFWGGLAGMAIYCFMEPSRPVPGQPVTTLIHGFWEAFAVRAFWPFLGMFSLGAVGMIRGLFR